MRGGRSSRPVRPSRRHASNRLRLRCKIQETTERETMKKSALLLAGLVTLAACETTPAAPPVSEVTVQAHVDTATRLAGADLQPLLSLCKPAPAVRPKVDEHDLAALIAKPSPPPGKAFDNLYFLGDSWVIAWALNTSDGSSCSTRSTPTRKPPP